MKPLDRDRSILQHIVSYCEQIELTVARFGDSYAVFSSDQIYRNATALCILQIGELVGKLTDDFRAKHPAVPWRQIKAMRNIVAHSYGTVDSETTWEVLKDDIPALKQYCQTILQSAD
jgi:uncharacterized protein with HEPN domain